MTSRAAGRLSREEIGLAASLAGAFAATLALTACAVLARLAAVAG